MSEYIVEMYDECEKYVLEYGCKPTNTQGFPLREEVVRCRDCKYADISYTHAAVTGELHCYGYLVESWDWYNDMPSDGVKVKPDGYCAWAERRIDDN